MSNLSSKKIYIDMFLNLLAAGIPLVVLQLVIYPFASRMLPGDIYGLMIAVYSLMLLVNDSLGKAANNIRLIRNQESINQKGDYNIIVAEYALFGSIILIGGVVFYGVNSILSVIVLVITGIMMVYNAYLIVYYRIRLNYVAILINALCMSLGFAAGFLLFCLTEEWSLVFLLGHSGCFLYLSLTTKMLGEPYKKTGEFKTVFSDTSVLALSTFLSQGMNLVDKLMLLPMLGGTSVSIYYTAALAGKVMSLATGPVNSVILTYIAPKKQLSRKTFLQYMTVCTLVCTVMAIIILILSRPVLGFLFPTYVEEAMRLVPYTTANVFLFVLAGMVTPLVMRYCDIKWQMVINGSGFALYVILAIVLLKGYGIIGFCVGLGISHLARLVLMLVVYEKRAFRYNIDI